MAGRRGRFARRERTSARAEQQVGQIIHHQSSFINSDGFTLIELLVVVGIIALLMAILMPVLSYVRKQAKATVCLSNLRQWGTIFALFLEDNEGRIPRLPLEEGDSALSFLRGIYITRGTDPNQAGRYNSVRTERIACCPSATRPGGFGTFTNTANGQVYLEGTLGSTFTAWEITRPAPSFRMSYGLNSNIFSIGFDDIRGERSIATPYTYLFNIRGRGHMPLLLDCAQPSCSLISDILPPPKREPSGTSGEVCINRHEGAVNVLFLDMGVKKVGLKGLWTLKWSYRFNPNGRWTKAGGVKPEDWPQWMRHFQDY